MDYCHFALIDTKGWALKGGAPTGSKLGKTQPLRMHWSGCPASCGNHTVSDIGLLGKNIKVNGEVVEAIDVSRRWRCRSLSPTFRSRSSKMCRVKTWPVRYCRAGEARRVQSHAANSYARFPQPPALGTQAARRQKSDKGEYRFGGDEIARRTGKIGACERRKKWRSSKNNGKLYGIQNICPHEGGQLCNGWIEGGEVVCPLHGYKFQS